MTDAPHDFVANHLTRLLGPAVETPSSTLGNRQVGYARSTIAATAAAAVVGVDHRVVSLVNNPDRPMAEDEGLLVVRVDGHIVEFAVLEWDSSCAGEDFYSMVFHGQGVGSGLREMRHTYWGEGGYLFYAPADVIAAAFEALKEWFDV